MTAAPADALPLVMIRLGAVRCALRHAAVQELLPLPRLWRPPGLPRPLEGFMNLGGEAVPVVALATLLGVEEAEDTAPALYRHLVLLRASPPVALRVTRVLDLRLVAPERLRPVGRGATLNGCVEAEIEDGESLVHLLDADRLLLAQERQALAELGREAERRLREWGAAPA